jgi:ribonuclease HI
MQVASSRKVVLFAIWLLQSTTAIPTAALKFAPSRSRTSTMVIQSPRTFTAMQAISRRNVLGQTTTTKTSVPCGQSLRLFSSKNPFEARTSTMMMIRGPRTFTAMQAISRRNMLGQKTTTKTSVPCGQSLRLFSSKNSAESTLKAVSLDSPDKKLTRTLVHRMNNDQIRAELEKRGMPSAGTKTERADRLLASIPSKRGCQISATEKNAAEKSAANQTIVNENTTNNIAKQKNETVYHEIIPSEESEKEPALVDIPLINNDVGETTSSKESNKEPGPVEISPTDTNMIETTMPEDSNKEPGPIDPTRTYILRVKGGSTKGTGGTGVGITLQDSVDPTLCWSARKYLSGDRSIFEAEYTGLVVGLRYAVRRGVRNVEVEIDHEVTTGHMKGLYEVTKPGLIPMFQTIMEIRDSLQSYSISRITKKENHKAQDLAHKAHATRISMHIEDSVDPMDGQECQGKRSQTVPEQQQKFIEVSVDPPEDQDREVKEEQKLPEQQQEPAAKPIEQVTPVKTNESIVDETGQPKRVEIDPTRLYKLEFDGGARGNPGVSGAGVVIYDDQGTSVWCAWKYLSKMTNNAAEYEALLLGLEGAKSLGIERLTVFGDSQLIVNQVNGKNKVSNVSMKEYWKLVMPLKRSFKFITINHFLREENKRADQLANHAMDTETTHQELRRFDDLY